MSWFLNAIQGKDKDAPRDDRGGGGRRNGNGNGRDGGRPNGDERDDGRERFDDLDEERGGGRRGGRGRHYSDSDSDDAAREREERQRQRAAREAQREREDEEDRARMDRMDPAEKDRRRDRFEDKDAEEDRKKQAAREQEQKAEDEARAALAADDLVQVSEPVAAEDSTEAESFNSGPVVQRKVLGNLGDPNPTWNNDAWHLYWSGVKVVILLSLFFAAIVFMTADYPIQACKLSPAFGFCLKSGPIDSTHSIRCWDQSDLTCLGTCETSGALSSGCVQTYVTGTTGMPNVASASCPPTDQFKDQCNNKKSCDPKWLKALKGKYTVAVAMFAIWVFFEALTGAGIFLWMGVHVDEFQTDLNQYRVNRWLMYLVKTYPRLNQIILVVVFIGWVLLMVGWSDGADWCAEAVDNDDKPLKAFSNALGFALGYGAIVLVAIVIGTLIRKFRPLRGELYIPSNDDELTPWCGMDFKDIRDRPYPRLCPDLWAECADPDSMMMCKPCGRPCKIFWNVLFSVVFAPIGWLIEQFFRHRHFMGT